MKCPVIVKFIRSDNKTLIVDGTDWILPNDGLDGFGEVGSDLSAVDKSVGDGSVLVSKRVNSIDREIKAVVTDKRLNQTLRYKATSFFNGKFSFKIFVTYMGRTRWCDGEIRKFFCPSENIYDKVYFSVTFFCANPFMKSEEDFGKNIAGVTPMVAFPYLCGLKTGEYKTTKSGKEITISGENTRIDAIQVHGESEQKSYSGKNFFDIPLDKYSGFNGESYCVTGKPDYKNENGIISWNGTIKDGYALGPYFKNLYSNIPVDDTTNEYTFSIEMRADQPIKGFAIERCPESQTIIKTSSDKTVDTNWKKYFATFKRTNTKANVLTLYTGKFISFSASSGSRVYVRNLQLEKGTVATPYEPYVGGKPSPNPDYPQEIVSKPTKIESNGANGEKSVANILTPLCGIKVASGGNYTDENGQQWITDELVKYEDGSGKYIKRIGSYTFDGSEDEKWRTVTTNTPDIIRFATEIITDVKRVKDAQTYPNCVFGIAKANTSANTYYKKDGISIATSNNLVMMYDSFYNKESQLSDFKLMLSVKKPKFIYELATHQETPLSSEQLAQFSNLKTYSPHCVISNDGNIPMNLQYVTIVGGKKHIEGRPTGRFDFARKVELHNDGDVEAYCKAIFVAKGEVTNPKLIINGKYVRVITTMHSDDVLVIDFTKDPPTVRLNGKNIIGQTDRTSNFDGMQLNIGDSEIGYDADTGTGLLDVSIYYNKLYGTM